MSKQESATIIQAYCDVLKSQAPKPGDVADERLLPFPKDKIKAEIIVALRNESDQNKIDRLKDSYLRLAEWQEGVGMTDQSLDVSQMNLNDDTEKLARQILAHGIDREK
jgi:hypothetical protein